MREPPNIPSAQLQQCLQERYAITADLVEFLPLGLDVNAGVYRVVSASGEAYFLKAKSRVFYAPSCQAPRYLWEQGITSVVAPIPTDDGTLWTQVGEWTLILYPFIEGASGWEPPMTADQWQALGAAISQIHHCQIPPHRLPSLRRERFDPALYASQIQMIETHYIYREDGSPSQQALRHLWQEQAATIHLGVTSLVTLAEALRQQAGPHVCCHADLHPNNVLRDTADQVYVIDWDDVMLAPKERDFLFIEDAPVAAAARQDASPFFSGYGQTAIDWGALTYYLWERDIQDVIECATTVLVRDDVAEITRAEELRVFRQVLAGYGQRALAAGQH